MRNPLKRLARPDQPKRPLRERLAGAKTKLVAVRERYGRTLRVHRALNAPPAPKPEPVERIALINYATWLFYERRLVCRELHPHMGTKSASFVHANVAADEFHFPSRAKGPVAAPSTRAVATLDALGIDWRRDRDEGDWTDPASDDPAAPLPFGWPALDAELTEALDDLTRLDAAIGAMHSGNPHRSGDLLPGFEGLEWGRNEALDRLVRVRAKGLPGLQAKAHAILADSVTDHLEDIAASLARDLIGALPSVLDQHRPDPVFAAIEEVRRLEAAAEAAEAATPKDTDVPPEYGAAVWECLRGTLLKTVPTTAEGCKALATFVPGFFERWGASMEADAPALFKLIARSPLSS